MARFGPVLNFRGLQSRRWLLSALVGLPGNTAPDVLRAASDNIAALCLGERNGLRLWRYDFALPQSEKAQAAEYSIGDRRWSVHVPGADASLHLAFTACNGSEAGDAWQSSKDRNKLWRQLRDVHSRRPFHLLLQGGDQLYADPIWSKVPALADWARLRTRQKVSRECSPDMARALGDFYFEAYCDLWAQAELAPILAEIPSLMMWDDHDITDGWGSYPLALQESPVVQCLWSAARSHFSLFQLAAQPNDLPEGFSDRSGQHFGWYHRIGNVGIVAPDLRSGRTRNRVLPTSARLALSAALEAMADCDHVLLLFTVPLVNAQFPILERLFSVLPGHQAWQDDLIDQWPSLAHRDEWSDLLRELVQFSSRTGAKLTSLSGEIHLGALGLVETPEVSIYQLTSSGIAHPPPPRTLTAMIEWASAREVRVEPDIAVKSLPMPGRNKKYLRERNWLELEVRPGRSLDAAWHTEGLNILRFSR